MEPEMCGCGEIYLNFGCFYDVDGLTRHRQALMALRQENQALYPAVYAHLRAARELQVCARASVQTADPEGLFRLTRGLAGDPPRKVGPEGTVRDVFLRAWTPDGLTDLAKSLDAMRCTRIALRDPCGLSAPLFVRLVRQYAHAGYDCVRLLSPVDPDRMEGLLVPDRGICFLSVTEAPPGCAVTVDVEHYFQQPAQCPELLARADAHCRDACRLLAQAKAIHDEIETLCRPFVSFDGVDLLTQEYKKQLRFELLRS